MTAAEIQAARRQLSSFRAEFARVSGWALAQGQRAGRVFGQRFRSAAMFGIRELAKGALQGIGQRIVEGWGNTGAKSGRAFARRMRQAQKAHSAAMVKSAASGFGMRLNLGAMPIVGAAALTALVVGQVRKALDNAFEQERIQISLDALSADGEGGKRIFQSIRQEALKTGIAVSSQASTIQKLMAQGMDEEAALKLNRALLDIAGGTGLATHEVALLGTALAQIKGKGVAAMEELRGQIAEKGVPVFEALRQRFGMEDVSQVFEAVSRGKISADEVLETFKNLEGPFARFIGAAERMGKTGGGMFARIKQQAMDLRRVFMENVVPEMKPMLESVISRMEALKSQAQEWGTALGNAIGTAKAALESLSLQEMMQLAGLTLKRELLAALDAARLKAVGMLQFFEDGSFERHLENAAMTFKRVMLEGALEVVDALSAFAPENKARSARDLMKGMLFSPLGMPKELLTQLKSPAAAALWDKINAARGSLGDSIAGSVSRARPSSLSEFLAGIDSGMSDADRYEMERLMQKIQMQRDATLAARGPEAPIVAPAPVGGGGNKGAFDPVGLLAGGLANAISRITGGGDIILSKQLATQEGTLRASEKTAKAAERTAKAVEQLAKNAHPRNRDSLTSARLVLG